MKTIYIAGKISGLPFDEVVKKFATAQTELEAQGYKVINPVERIIMQNEKRRANGLHALTDENDRAEILKICLCNIIYFCDAIYMLKDWDKSSGAILEYHVSCCLQIEQIFEEEYPYEYYDLSFKIEGKTQKKDTNDGISYGFHAENGGIEQSLQYIKSNDDAGLNEKQG